MSVLKYGDQGDAVNELHQALLERGLTVAPAELAAEQFGPTTLDAVTRFQRRERLAVDGIVGKRTMAALHRLARVSDGLYDSGWLCDVEPGATDPVSFVVNAALMDMGMREEGGQNRGPVEKYGAFLDGKWQPYCAAAVAYWFRRLAPPPVPASLMSGYKWVEWARTNKRLVISAGRPVPGFEDASKPRVGDVWIARNGQKSWRSHVELIVHVGERLSTVGGNTSNMVRGSVRPLNSYTHLVRVFP